MKENNLLRFSLLSSGAIKKAQVLGGKLRLMAFEWTHLACPKTVYERIVESMVVKIPHPQNAAELQKKVVEMYGADARLGWFHRGSSTKELIEEYGPPKESGDGYLKWSKRFGDYFHDLKVAVKEEQFLHFYGEGYQQSSEAVEGTASWVEEQLDPPVEYGDEDPFATDEDPFAIDGDDKPAKSKPVKPKPQPKKEKPKWKEPDLDALTKVMVKNALSEKPLKSYRSTWCEVALKMIEKKADPKPLIEVFLETREGSWGEQKFIDLLSLEQKKSWYQLVIRNFWKALEKGDPQYRSYPHFHIAYIIGGLSFTDPPAAKTFLADLEKLNTPKTNALRLYLLEDWSAEAHVEELKSQFSDLEKTPDQNKLAGLLEHLKEQTSWLLSPEDYAFVTIELQKLKPHLTGQNLEWCETSLKQLKRNQ